MAIWDDVLTGTDRAVFESKTYMKARELGKRPAIIVVDMSYSFTGSRPVSVLEAMEEYASACGKVGWDAVPKIRALIEAGRRRDVPIIYSTTVNDERYGSHWARRARSAQQLDVMSPEDFEQRRRGNDIVDEIAPQFGDILLRKRGPSVFSGTPLLSYLNEFDIDTVIVSGTTTSGCVRASVVDAAAHRYYVGVVEECTFDRLQISHKVALLDMHFKYGNVVSLADAVSYLDNVAESVLRAPGAQASTVAVLG